MNKPIPAGIWWLMTALVIIVMLVVTFNQFLRRQVNLKTRDLFESENRLNTILNNLDAIVYIKDRQHRYRYINEKITALTGLAPEALIGESDDKIFDESTCQHLRHNDLKVLEYGERLVEEEEVSDATEGETRHFLSVKIPLRDAHDKIYALCGISTDITHNKKMHERLKALEFSDPLTGLPNRFELFRRIDKVMQVNPSANGAVMVVDVDDLKSLTSRAATLRVMNCCHKLHIDCCHLMTISAYSESVPTSLPVWYSCRPKRIPDSIWLSWRWS